jgi:hypothetical protein
MGQRAQAGPPAAELFLNSNKPPAVPGQKACSIASRATRTDSTPLADSFLMLPATFMGQRIQVASTIARARGSNRVRSCIRIVAYIACESYLSPRWGLSGSHFYPRLAPWAAFLRRSAAKRVAFTHPLQSGRVSPRSDAGHGMRTGVSAPHRWRACFQSGGFVCLVGTSAEILRWESFASEGLRFLRMTGIERRTPLPRDDSHLKKDSASSRMTAI